MKSSSFAKAMIAGTMAFALLPSLAFAGIFDDDEARRAIVDVRAKIEALTLKLDAKLDTKADKSSALELSNQNELLRAEVAKLRGQIEVLTNDLANTQRRQQDFYVDLDNRLRKLEPRKMTVDGVEMTIEVSEQRAYDAAMALFKATEYKSAGETFYAFTQTYPKSALLGLAQYWLGNSYYAQRDCKNTISSLQILVKNHPDHPKTPDAMLNIAACQLELKDKAASKKTLETVISQYPTTEAAEAAKNRLASVK